MRSARSGRPDAPGPLSGTLLAGGRSRAILASALGSPAALAVVVETPGLSHFFGCTPLGPVARAIALSSEAAATPGSLFLPALVSRVRAWTSHEWTR
ncbi:hypothetical protein [Streptomyces incanus]|uniref:Uncharacterized protein n=1 Tax=Streptomyces incanus TaxID=887453 RepID=A0ABW0XQB0_9ACTN